MTVPSVLSDFPSYRNCSPYRAEIYASVAAVAAAINAISVVVNCLVIFFIVLFKRWSFFSQRLVLYLSLATIVVGIASIFSRAGYKNETGAAYDNFCMFSGFILQIAGWMVLNAYVCITTSLLLKVLFVINLEKYDVATLLFIFASPLVINWVPFIKLTYGKAGAWCWIKSIDQDSCEEFLFGRILQLVLWYIPLYAIICVLIIIYFVVVTKLCLLRKNRIISDPEAETQMRFALKHSISLLAYPVIYFVANIFPLINRVYNGFNPNEPSPALWFLSGIFSPLQGVGIAVAFLLDGGIRKRLNVVNLKAACVEWVKKPQIQEYPLLNGDDREQSIEYKKCSL